MSDKEKLSDVSLDRKIEQWSSMSPSRFSTALRSRVLQSTSGQLVWSRQIAWSLVAGLSVLLGVAIWHWSISHELHDPTMVSTPTSQDKTTISPIPPPEIAQVSPEENSQKDFEQLEMSFRIAALQSRLSKLEGDLLTKQLEQQRQASILRRSITKDFVISEWLLATQVKP